MARAGWRISGKSRQNIVPVSRIGAQLLEANAAHLEITNLVIPELNDNETDFEKMVKWIADNLGSEVPLHLSRYFPQYEMDLQATPTKKLIVLYELAKQYLQFVYLGNVADEKHSSTYCPQCENLLISRNRYSTKINGLSDHKTCKACGNRIKIVI